MGKQGEENKERQPVEAPAMSKERVSLLSATGLTQESTAWPPRTWRLLTPFHALVGVQPIREAVLHDAEREPTCAVPILWEG